MSMELINTEIAIMEPSEYEVMRISLVGLTMGFVDRDGRANEQRVAENVALIMHDVGLEHLMVMVRRESLTRAGRIYRGVQMKCFLEEYNGDVQRKLEAAVKSFLQHFCLPGKGEAYMTIGSRLYRFFLRSQQPVMGR